MPQVIPEIANEDLLGAGSSVSEFLGLVRNWDGGAATRTALIGRLNALKVVRISGPIDTEIKAELWKLPDTATRLAGSNFYPKDPTLAAAFRRLLIGAEEFSSAWPYDSLHREALADRERIKWLQACADALPSAGIHEFVSTVFEATPRDVWTAAARTWAVLATRDPGVHHAAAQLCRAAWSSADGQTLTWPAVTKAGARSKSDPARIDAHALRHTFVLACALAGNGSPVEGLGADVLAAVRMPKDMADASAVLLGMVELARAPSLRAALVAPIRSYLATRREPDMLLAEALHALIDNLRRCDDDAAGALRTIAADHLVAAGTAARSLETAWTIRATALWLKEHGDVAAIARLRAASGAWALFVEIVLPSNPAALPDVRGLLVERLQLLDPIVWECTSQDERTVAIAEALLLVSSATRLKASGPMEAAWRSLGETSWRSLCIRALGREAGAKRTNGLLADTGFVDLLTVLLDRVPDCGSILRNQDLDDTALALFAGREIGSIDQIVAVKVEQKIRALVHTSRSSAGSAGCPDPLSKFVWSVLEANPDTGFFAHLYRISRHEPVVHTVVAAMSALDLTREKSLGETRIALAALVEVLRHGAGDADGIAFTALSRTLERAEAILGRSRPTDGTAGTVAVGRDLARRVRELDGLMDGKALAQLLETASGQRAGLVATWVGATVPGGTDTTPSGLVRWLAWRGWTVEQLEQLAVAYARLTKSAKVLEETRSREDTDVLRERFLALMDASRDLRHVLDGTAWPERSHFAKLLDGLGTDAGAERGVIEEDRRTERDVARAVADRQFAWLEQLAEKYVATGHDNPRLPGAAVRRIHGHLLGALRVPLAVRVARRYRARTRLAGTDDTQDIALQGIVAYFAPLLIGALAGPLLTMQSAATWNDLAQRATSPGCIATVLIGPIASFALLAQDLDRALVRTHPFRTRVRQVLERVGALLAGLIVMEAVEVWAVRLTLGDTAAVRASAGDPPAVIPFVLVWTSVSLFLGIFLGLVAQGRSMVAVEGW